MRTPTFYITTVGCAKNEVDSDVMVSRLIAAGYTRVCDPAHASVIVVNTCGFLASATVESVETTLAAAQAGKAAAHRPKVVMCGCVPSRYGSALARELPEVDAFVPANQEASIARVVSTLLSCVPPREGLQSRAPILRSASGSFAFIKISEGCDRRCSFCAIPAIRGPQISKSAQEILAEARYLAQKGARELVLVGQDTSAWGHDLASKPTLASLLWELNDHLRDLGPWIRVLYVQPEGLDDPLIEAFAHAELVVPYVDMPLQHVSAPILRSMGRKGDAEFFSSLIKKLRSRVPKVVLRTTVMSGYPGETDKDHEQLLAFLQKEAFDYVAVFSFSAEEGTRAFELGNQVGEDVKQKRTQELMDVAEALGFASCARRVGSTVEVIVDGERPNDPDGRFIGHAYFQAPDTDGVVHLSDGALAVGERYHVLLEDAWCYDLQGSVVYE